MQNKKWLFGLGALGVGFLTLTLGLSVHLSQAQGAPATPPANPQGNVVELLSACKTRGWRSNVTYQLNRNIQVQNVAGGNCMIITGPTTLDCLGFEIIGPNTNIGTGINIKNSRVTVQNCVVSKFQTGIAMNNVTDSSLIANTTHSNSLAGISVNGGNNTIRGNTSWGNMREGVLLSNGYNNSVTANTVRDNGTFGIRLYRESNATVESNNITGHTHDSGISISEGRGHTLAGNNVNQNKNGINLSNTARIVISGNGVADNRELGIYFGDYSDRVTLNRNTVCNNTLQDFNCGQGNFGILGTENKFGRIYGCVQSNNWPQRDNDYNACQR